MEKNNRIRHQNTTVAIGMDENGDLTLSTNQQRTPVPIQNWADDNGIEVVNSGQVNVHAEESVYNNAQNEPVIMGSSKPICQDGQDGMDHNDVTYNSENTSGKQSRNRKEGGTYEGTHGDWDR